jgi:hypothetical protein
VIQNTSGGTLTITPNAGASNLIDGSATGTVPNNSVALVYSDGVSNWNTIKFPNTAGGGGGGGGNPGGSGTNIQNRASSTTFGGIAGSTADDTNGLMGLAPTGTGVALTITGDAASSDILDLYSNGGSSPIANLDSTGELHFQKDGAVLYASNGSGDSYSTLESLPGNQLFVLATNGNTFVVEDAVSSTGATQVVNSSTGSITNLCQLGYCLQTFLVGSLQEAVNAPAFATNPTFDLFQGNIFQFSCTTPGASITPSFTDVGAGIEATFVFVQNGTTACTWTWPGSVIGGGTVSATLNSISIQKFISYAGTNLYSTNAMLTH